MPAVSVGIERTKIIDELIEKNEKNNHHSYSRQCYICAIKNPDKRAVLTTCGHTLCLACVMQLENRGHLQCPFCRMRTAYVKLHEDKEEENRKEVGTQTGNEEDNDENEETDSGYENEKIETSLDWLNLLSSVTPTASPSTELHPALSHPNLAFPTVRPNTPKFRPTVPPPTVPSRKVIISNVAAHATAVDLEQLFSWAGRVVFVDLPRDRLTAQPLGYAYCLFHEEESARLAVNMFDGATHGNILCVRIANQ